MLKMYIDDEEVVSNNEFTIKEEILSPSSTILNNVYPKGWEENHDYISNFYYPKDYSKLNIQKFTREQEAEGGTTIQVDESATLTDVDTTKESRVLRLLGQTEQDGTPTPSSPIDVNVVSGNNTISVCGVNVLPNSIENQTINGITVTRGVDGTLTLNGTSTAITYLDFSTNFNTTIYAGYKFYGFPSNAQGLGVRISTSNRSSLQDIGANGVVLNDNGANKYIALRIGSGITLNNYVFQPMLIPASIIYTTYEPYQGTTYPINLGSLELCKIGDYQDYIFHNVSTSPYYDDTLTEGSWYKYAMVGKTTDTSGSTSITISDMVSGGSIYSYYGGTVSGTTITYDSAISGTNAIYYQLSTPTYTEITDDTLVSQLDALESS